MSERHWIKVECIRALYVDHGRDIILCDRLPSDCVLVLALTDKQREDLINALTHTNR